VEVTFAEVSLDSSRRLEEEEEEKKEEEEVVAGQVEAVFPGSKAEMDWLA
jgi:hypothetical protein